jgi:hypothetical protein
VSVADGKRQAEETAKHFDAFVRSIGGERVEDLLVNKSEVPSLADYLLWDRSVVAELKCIVTDHSASHQVGKRFASVATALLKSRAIGPKQITGRRVRVDESVDFASRRDLADTLVTPMRKLANKASSQIRTAIEHFELDDALGLLIVVNLADRRLTAKKIEWIFQRAVRGHEQTLHFVMFTSPNIGFSNASLNAVMPNGDQPLATHRKVVELAEQWLTLNEESPVARMNRPA